MKSNSEYSRTAEGMALLRAIEQFQPEPERILNDPHAADLLQQPLTKAIGRSRLLAYLYSLWFSRFAPGAQVTLVTRARLADDIASELAKDGLRQIVVLGAGFDLMPLRRRYELQDATIFEMDHPATQLAKRTSIGNIAPGNVRFIPVNFEDEDFGEKLVSNGFDPNEKSLFLWLGVTYYLTSEAVEKTLERLSILCKPGTNLVFDYLLASVLDGTTTDKAALNHAKFIGRLGEPWLWGIYPEQISGFIGRFGFKLITDYDSVKLRNLYRHDRPMMSYVRIVHCVRE
ncbi:MAG TPA: SAM-dependent methyltransferase [Blastocatellia bacterium]|nr:SAM-dependent methyltransferase [Blastocatellia bacterium]